MNKINLISISLLLLSLGLSSCTTSEDQKKSSIGDVSIKTAETATKPLTTTAAVVKDSVVGVNTVMDKVMKDVNSAIAIPVEERGKEKSDSTDK